MQQWLTAGVPKRFQDDASVTKKMTKDLALLSEALTAAEIETPPTPHPSPINVTSPVNICCPTSPKYSPTSPRYSPPKHLWSLSPSEKEDNPPVSDDIFDNIDFIHEDYIPDIPEAITRCNTLPPDNVRGKGGMERGKLKRSFALTERDTTRMAINKIEHTLDKILNKQAKIQQDLDLFSTSVALMHRTINSTNHCIRDVAGKFGVSCDIPPTSTIRR